MSRSRSLFYPVISSLFALLWLSPLVRAGESPRCRRGRAEAEATASVLRWPRLVVEGIRFPSSSRLDLGPTIGSHWQPRVGAAFSPLEFYRGGAIEEVSEAACALDLAMTELEEALQSRDEWPRAQALGAQAAYLQEHRGEWESLRFDADKRFEARVITAVERHELLRLTEDLERKAIVAQGESARLLARRPSSQAAGRDPQSLSSQLSVRTLELAEREAHVRRLDAWGFKVSGGFIPLPGQALDWYGLAEVSYSLGALSQRRAQERAVIAQREELSTARDQAPFRQAKQTRELGEALAQARGELAVIESSLAREKKTTETLAASDAPGALHARDTLALERLSAEADQVFLRTLIEELTPLVAEATRP